MWVRGLKLVAHVDEHHEARSHPMWVRGLKHYRTIRTKSGVIVAPYVGAWIETISPRVLLSPCGVAPYVGAWIETS